MYTSFYRTSNTILRAGSTDEKGQLNYIHAYPGIYEITEIQAPEVIVVLAAMALAAFIAHRKIESSIKKQNNKNYRR